MQKRSISGKDILRMDGLLPPTRRVPVCDAVTSTSDKKREKKWSIGGILKRISSIRDYESSSNEEEMVYCKREPRRHMPFNQKTDGVTLRPIQKNSERYSNKNSSTAAVENASQSPDMLNLRRDSIHSRSSDGSIDGLGKKARKNKLKARAEAKRDRICVDSSSDEDSRKSCNSLTRFQNEDYNSPKNTFCNRKSRAARTERYIKRLSKDEGHGPTESLSDITNKRNSLDFVDATEAFRPPIHPRSFVTQSNSHTLPVQRSIENLREFAVGLPDTHTRSSVDLTKYPKDRCIADLNQNNSYAKPNILKTDVNYVNQQADDCFLNPSIVNVKYNEPTEHTRYDQAVNRSACPPEPPPRDPRCRIFAYNCHSFPFNGRSQRVTKFGDTRLTGISDTNEGSRPHMKNSYGSNSEISWCGSLEQYPGHSMSLKTGSVQSCNLRGCTNNKHKSTGRHVDETVFNETEAMKCWRRNNRNEQLNSTVRDHNILPRKNSYSVTINSKPRETSSPIVANEPVERLCVRSPSGRTTREYPRNITTDTYNEDNKRRNPIKEDIRKSSEQDSLERKRSSKNLEEALSELEAIYNSLRLGDEDLLDRAERRSMEEFSLRQGRTDNTIQLNSPDLLDRTKDDMAYRKMHPKERPASLSEVIGQSALSNISYLMASPISSRKDAADDYLYPQNYPARRDEPDVTRDDVVYRSIHHSNNMLKVVEPQPPFGIPLGPVTTATESDYLHTTPTKTEHPRSPYIPQCEPDIVTDDLAYRALRKDANTPKNVIESKTVSTRDPTASFGMKKKRAVRSLSANLYGLINQDRIHLRREPSLQEISDEIKMTSMDVKSFTERPGYRRVVSDGELSDYDTRWHTDDSLKNNIDINGNHPISNLHRRKLRVYVSPSTKVQSKGDQKNGANVEVQSSVPSDVVLPSKALDDEFWHDYLRSESTDSPSSTNKETESDFTAYSRLCQDLVNLIEGPDVKEIKPIEGKVSPGTVKRLVETDEQESPNNPKSDEPSILRIQSLGSQYSEPGSTSNHNQIAKVEDTEKLSETGTTSSDKKDLKNSEDNTIDFYLRLADENVKLIAEAFSSVADHLRDSRLSQKYSLTSQRSEIENDSTAQDTSTRSSVIYSQDEANDERSSSSKTVDKSDVVPKGDTTTILEGDQKEIDLGELKSDPNADAELDLSRAVHDLHVAAASLCEYEKEIEELGTRLKKDPIEYNCEVDKNVMITEVESALDGDENVSPETGKQEQERNQEKTVVSTDNKAWADKPDSDCEGESIECELICKSYDVGIRRFNRMRIPYVTNIIALMITTYSMVLLACFLALLLATIAAS